MHCSRACGVVWHGMWTRGHGCDVGDDGDIGSEGDDRSVWCVQRCDMYELGCGHAGMANDTGDKACINYQQRYVRLDHTVCHPSSRRSDMTHGRGMHDVGHSHNDVASHERSTDAKGREMGFVASRA